MKYRTKADPKQAKELREEIVKHGRVGGFEVDGRTFLDPRPMAARPKVREQMSPLEAMYAEIRGREQAARDAEYSESDEERQDFDIPEDLDELLSGYEEFLQPDLSVLGEAVKDPRVKSAIQAALEDRYGTVEQLGLQAMAKERQTAPEGRQGVSERGFSSDGQPVKPLDGPAAPDNRSEPAPGSAKPPTK